MCSTIVLDSPSSVIVVVVAWWWWHCCAVDDGINSVTSNLLLCNVQPNIVPRARARSRRHLIQCYPFYQRLHEPTTEQPCTKIKWMASAMAMRSKWELDLVSGRMRRDLDSGQSKRDGWSWRGRGVEKWGSKQYYFRIHCTCSYGKII